MVLVDVHFHYARGVVGLGIARLQQALRYRHWRFTHVSFTLNALYYERHQGETTIAGHVVGRKVSPYVTLRVPTQLNEVEVMRNAYDYLEARGEGKFECATFVSHCLGTRHRLLPAALFNDYAELQSGLLADYIRERGDETDGHE